MRFLFFHFFVFAMIFSFSGCISEQINDPATDEESIPDEENILEPDDSSDDSSDEISTDLEEPDLEQDEDLLPPLEASITASKETVYEHGSVEFTAEATGGTPPYMFKWDFGDAAPENTNEKTGEIEFTLPGEYTVTLTVMDFDENTFETDLAFTIHPLEGDMNFYFGNLHSHSAVSDGKGTPAEVMEWAKNHENLDFYAMTDHSEQILSFEWDSMKHHTDLATEDGVFVALRGFEWSHPIFGHINVYETEKYSAVYSQIWIKDFYKWVEEHDGMGHFNHPGRETDHFNNLKLEPNVLSHMFGIETGNKGTSNYDGEFVSYYIKALDNGWHVAPTNNQDNHKLEMNSRRTAYIGENLTRANLIDAMKARRLYSSDDPDIKIVFKLDEHWMGEHVTVSDSLVQFSIKVMDNEPVKRMELITNKGLVAAYIDFDEEEDTTTVFWFPNLVVTQNSYFFLKVTSVDIYDSNDDIQIALTAPIWIYK